MDLTFSLIFDLLQVERKKPLVFTRLNLTIIVVANHYFPESCGLLIYLISNKLSTFKAFINI